MLNTEKQLFESEKHGYSKKEVHTYIENLSSQLELKNHEVENLNRTIKEQSTKLEEYKKIDRELRDTLIFFKETERDTIIKTKDKIEEMLNEADIKSEEIITKAEDEAKSTRDTLLFLKEQREILIARLKIIIDNQEGMLIDLTRNIKSDGLQKTVAEAAAFRTKSELNIDKILERLL